MIFRKKNVLRLIIIVSVLTISGLMVILSIALQKGTTFEEELTYKGDSTTSYIDSSVLNGLPFQEDLEVYNVYDDKVLYYAYITVLPSTDSLTGEAVTLETLNSVKSVYNNPEVNVIFQEGDARGPYENIYDSSALIPNGIMKVRGFSARESPQKSWKVKLSGVTGDFLGQTVLNFNKHRYDPLRSANKFCLDALEQIPNIGSLNTYFVKVYIRDLSEYSDTGYVNYGMFTMVEQPNKSYLRRHGLDENGALYKAMNFSFSDDYGVIRSESDPYYDEVKFEESLEIAENPDHDKLIEMMEAINDDSLNINYVMDTYFNRENYLTWMATNIILGNIDAIVNNFLLYSPLNSKTWYFLPWDYDGTLLHTKQLFDVDMDYPESFFGLANFWNIDIHSKFFKDPGNLKDLNETIDMIMDEYLSIQDCDDITVGFQKALEVAAFDMPDVKDLKITADEMIYNIDNIYDILKGNIDMYYKNLELPMPIFMASVQSDENKYIFAWDSSYDFQGDMIYYTLYVSTDFSFNNVIYTKGPIIDTTDTVIMDLAPGKYYYKVLMEDENGNKQTNREEYVDPLTGNSYWGVREFVVE